MIRRVYLSLGLLWASAMCCAGAADLSPGDFAYGMQVTTPVAAAAYRATVPLEVYRKVVHEDLSDLRVFNARGEEVPYELQQPEPKTIPRSEGPSMPLFPLQRDAHVALDGLRITIQSQQTAINVQGRASTSLEQAISSYVVDARQVTLPLRALELHWPEDAAEFSGNIRVESSDDLGSWHIVTADAPVINLRNSTAQLVQSRIEIPATTAKFWHLTWLGKTAPFELTSITADTAPDRSTVERASLTVLSTPVSNKSQEYSFDLGARPPVNQINVELPEPNSAAKIQVLSRARETDPWRPITRGQFYRVRNTGSERRNPPITIAKNSDRFWLARLEQASPAIGHGYPKLEATWNAEDIVFLARGPSPFLLAYGNGSAGAGSAPLAELLNGVTVLRVDLGTPRALGGPARLLAAPRAFPWRSTVLWTVLAAGVLLLAYMAYRLSRELAKRPTAGQ
jgi:Protein of unknown function (DUF3999)